MSPEEEETMIRDSLTKVVIAVLSALLIAAILGISSSFIAVGQVKKELEVRKTDDIRTQQTLNGVVTRQQDEALRSERIESNQAYFQRELDDVKEDISAIKESQKRIEDYIITSK